ncbi:MAG: NHLP leader peptide family RiPP precursor [Gemmatimonadota bacterium]
MANSSDASDSIRRRQFVGRAASVVGASTLLGAGALQAGEPSDEYCEKPQRARLEGRLIARAWSDPGYMEALKSNPARMLARELGIEVPGDVRIRAVQETLRELYFVIPVNPNELSEKRISRRELEAVASGIRFNTPCAIPSSMMPGWFHALGYHPRSDDV